MSDSLGTTGSQWEHACIACILHTTGIWYVTTEAITMHMVIVRQCHQRAVQASDRICSKLQSIQCNCSER